MADTDPTNPTPEEDSLGTWQQELSELLALAKPVLVEVSLGKRKENNWKTIKWTFIATVVLGSLLAYLIFSAKMLGFQADPITTAVARVQITGPRSAMDAGIFMVPEDRKGLGLNLGRSAAANMTLSQQRARAVAQALTRAGMPAPVFEVAAAGDAGAVTPSGQDELLRRRTEVIVEVAPR